MMIIMLVVYYYHIIYVTALHLRCDDWSSLVVYRFFVGISFIFFVYFLSVLSLLSIGIFAYSLSLVFLYFFFSFICLFDGAHSSIEIEMKWNWDQNDNTHPQSHWNVFCQNRFVWCCYCFAFSFAFILWFSHFFVVGCFFFRVCTTDTPFVLNDISSIDIVSIRESFILLSYSRMEMVINGLIYTFNEDGCDLV